jgi:2-polyprenyl-6-methoxyphenol hydroxylase-like FAD-dependent oxidoreductase
LAQWGLLDTVRSTGVQHVQDLTMTIAGNRLPLPVAPPGAIPPIAPRRTVLDPILVDAATQAGAVVQHNTTVTDLRTDGTRVCGVVARGADGETVLPARLVIGADGRRSHVAKLLDAQEHTFWPAASFGYYSYWDGIDLDGMVVNVRHGGFTAFFPTNDGKVVGLVQLPRAGFDAFRADADANYVAALRATPEVDELLRGAQQVERLRGIGDIPTFFRTSAGPGWALVGDAGHHKDPIIARGISDAFRDADLLAAAVTTAWDGDDGALDAALARYQQERDDAALALAAATDRCARLDLDGAELLDTWMRLIEIEIGSDPTGFTPN